MAVIDDGSTADSRSVDKIPRRHIGKEPDTGVGFARGVVKERIESDGGVGAACGVAKERVDSAGGVEAAGGVALRHSNVRSRQQISLVGNGAQEKICGLWEMAIG